jgi:hypothetical protein
LNFAAVRRRLAHLLVLGWLQLQAEDVRSCR